MLSFDVTRDRILTLHPRGSLQNEDLESLSLRLMRCKRGALEGIILETPLFPAWRDFVALVARLSFFRGRFSKTPKFALLTNESAEPARHFLREALPAGVVVRRFPLGEDITAKRWLGDGAHPSRSPSWHAVTRGAMSGLLATVPMTAFMHYVHAKLPEEERYPLPPRTITMKAAEVAEVKEGLSEKERQAATYAAHFGYGAAVGALYPLIEPSIPGSKVTKGVGYGLAVWLGSYLGILPLLHLYKPVTRDSWRRNALMVGAHVVWGASLGALAAPLKGR